MPQPPQLAVSLSWLDSQPLSRLLSQVWKPALHIGAHIPAKQLFEEVLLSRQAVPQAPQFFLSEASTTAQPLLAMPSQLANAVPQLGVHLLAAHAFEPCGAIHAALHAPQWLLSEVSSASQPSMSCLLQSAKPVLHLSSTHELALHFPVPCSGPNSALQLVPQVPQLAPSKLVSVAQPRPLPAQSLNGGVQVFTTHLPATHLAVPFATLHTAPHFPQLFGSESVFVSQPSV